MTPAKPAPKSKTKKKHAPTELSGTAWKMKMSNGGRLYTFHFLPNGQMRMYLARRGWDDSSATWEQTDTQVVFSIDGGSATYRGALQGGKLVGAADNVNGVTWRFAGTYAGPARPPQARKKAPKAKAARAAPRRRKPRR